MINGQAVLCTVKLQSSIWFQIFDLIEWQSLFHMQQNSFAYLSKFHNVFLEFV